MAETIAVDVVVPAPPVAVAVSVSAPPVVDVASVGIAGPPGVAGPPGPPGPLHSGTIGIVIDGGGSVITPGVKGFYEVGVPCTITAVTLLSADAAATAGAIVVDVWKTPYASYPPTVANTITASAQPTLSSASKSKDTTLTGWTTAIAAGDVLGFSVSSATTVTKVSLTLTVQLT